MLCGLAYPAWFVLPVFVLASPKREDPFLHFHALQGLLFGMTSSAASVVLMLAIWVLFRVLPGAGGTFSGMLGVAVFTGGMLGGLVLFLVSLFLGWRASAGQFLRLPLLGDVAEARMARNLDLDYTQIKIANSITAQVEDPKLFSWAATDGASAAVPANLPPLPENLRPQTAPTPPPARAWTPPPADRPKANPAPWTPPKVPAQPPRQDPGSVVRRWISEE